MHEIGTATDYRDLLAKLNTFLTATGSAFGLTYAGTGNGTLTDYKGGSASVAEVFTITATSSTNFTVVGSSSGSLAAATVGTPYTGTKVQFLLTAGGTAFVAGDKFTFSTAPKWTALRADPGALVSATGATTGQYACENLIDGKLTYDTYRNWQAGALPKTVTFTFAASHTIVEYVIQGPYTESYSPRTWTFEYWSGSAWVVADTRTGLTFAQGERRTFVLASGVASTQFRLVVTAANTTTLSIDAVCLHEELNGHDRAMSQYIWQAPGNDGLSEIIVGAHALRRDDIDYFDWELCAFTGFSATLGFYAQPGYHGKLWIPLLNTSISYWFVADGRRVVVIAKIGSQYEAAYLGFIEPYFTPQQFPYPIALGGTLAFSGTDGSGIPYWNSASFRYSNSTNYHRSFTHSDYNIWGYLYDAQARLRRLDGVWRQFFVTNTDGVDGASTHGWLWPLCHGMSNLDICIDGSYALIPIVFSEATPNHWGQFSGVVWLTGQGLSAETLVRVGQVDYLALPNINRTDKNDWFAVRLD
jgi:hypothetical protein